MESRVEKVKPYDSESDKKVQIEKMFDTISSRYDFFNRFLTLGIDKSWRRNLIKIISNDNPTRILDVATGTGDLAIQAAHSMPKTNIVGLDLSEGMLKVGEKKVKEEGLQNRISMKKGDIEEFPFASNSFDAVMVGFGVRNFESLLRGLKEMYRVLKPGGRVYVLELSRPKSKASEKFFNMYFKYVMPMIMGFTSKDPAAYKYLFKSIQAFPAYEDFLDIMNKAEFKSNKYRIQSFGICSIYCGVK